MDKRIIMIAALALAAAACGDDDNNDSDGGGIVIRTDASIANPSIDASIDGSTPAQDGGVAGDGSTPAVKGAPGCFAGTPTTSVQFLNACAEGYREFDNTKRLPGYVKGQPLPAL